ncbi:hypothetical protein CC1G_12529 [Coprinopsis cinerea okayama7|uniref:Uncharacterized protein n=1 Tax=Coprinopsis cinerea (strain Okayama-7 / 130 / ATCC MYA-4618 / FGSC 9003) TaxID=240176 RepID=A8NMW8_COPC7|nr:hypothetical protein CC1G_12529 [Coprinopsis cinerea okayama7\|eukprot:XP_001835004.1 hypothetical protein CC1G_12529 [Coprinopsis cinerea okayama7\
MATVLTSTVEGDLRAILKLLTVLQASCQSISDIYEKFGDCQSSSCERTASFPHLSSALPFPDPQLLDQLDEAKKAKRHALRELRAATRLASLAIRQIEETERFTPTTKPHPALVEMRGLLVEKMLDSFLPDLLVKATKNENSLDVEFRKAQRFISDALVYC